MSIFGTAYPKFVYNHGISGEVTINLEQARVLSSSPQEHTVDHVDELSLDTDIVHTATHWKVVIRAHFYKNNFPSTLYNLFSTYRGVPVSLWLHSDGHQFMKSATDDAMFMLTHMEQLYLTDNYQYDAVDLTFQSLDPIYRTGSYSKLLSVFTVRPGYAPGTFFLPVRPSTDDYFLFPLAEDGSLVGITARGRDWFTVSPSMSGGAIKILFVDQAVNALATSGFQCGKFTAATEPTLVSFGVDMPYTSYLLLILSESGAPVSYINKAVGGFEGLVEGFDQTDAWYLAIPQTDWDTTPDTQYGQVQVESKLLAWPGGDAVTLDAAMPNAEYMTIAIDPDTRELVTVSSPLTTGFSVSKVQSTANLFYAVFGREEFSTL